MCLLAVVVDLGAIFAKFNLCVLKNPSAELSFYLEEIKSARGLRVGCFVTNLGGSCTGIQFSFYFLIGESIICSSDFLR